ncbi:hypothetical protein [Shewanella colwelliana]|uniref:hypothetical protein n=1 Tax=Shewanella colwelliana TaxID=23 RepID=UPI0004B76519|nr:hypothetical protein [Shewanella colwelliana]MDX1282259.1 peptidase M3 [Shewanella colwelliana]
MLKRILAIALAASLHLAAQAASPIALLSQQCVQFELPTATAFAANDAANQAIALERATLGLFNLKDRVNYYRQFTLNSDDNEMLIQCQLHLADEMSQLLRSPALINIERSLASSAEPAHQRLHSRLTQLSLHQHTLAQKAQQHSAQATILHGLKSQGLTLDFGDTLCQLNLAPSFESTDKPFNQSIASYLIKQQDTHCKQLVWQAYQTRAKSKNHAALRQLIDSQNHLAQTRGFSDHASDALSGQLLATPKLLKQYLDGMTHVTLSPWEIGSTLANAPKTRVTKQTSDQFINQLYQALAIFDLRAEIITPQLHRLWHGERLLGDIYFMDGAQIRATRIRQTVVGMQFGQFSLRLPITLDSYRDQQQLLTEMSKIITQFSHGSRYYLVNTLGETQDSSAIAQHWLAQYLGETLLPTLTQSSREAILQTFATQQKVFRSKLALNAYQIPSNALYTNLNNQFYLSFNHHWPEASDAIYSFSGIAKQGPLYYQALWQQSLGQFLYVTSKHQHTIPETFSLLLINEDHLSLNEQLTQVLGKSLSTTSLIDRILYVQANPLT